MAQGNRNQRQAAKAARRRAVVADRKHADRLASSLSSRVGAAAVGQIERCIRTDSLFEAGIGHVVLARRLSSQVLRCAFFLVDILCLGVKDAYVRDMAPSELDEHVAAVEEEGQAFVAIDPASACKLVTGAVAFAATCGIDPAKDYRTIAKIFGDIDPATSAEAYTYGVDGKAIYIPGPNASATRIREVERILDRALGHDGWELDPPSRNPTLGRLAEMLGPELEPPPQLRDEADLDGPIIEHEGSTAPEAGLSLGL